jgi:hypothetical protein
MGKQKFTTQKGGQRKQTLADFKRYLNEVSGNDPLELINAYMNTREGIHQKKIRDENHLDPKLIELVDTLKCQHEITTPYLKRQILSQVATLFSMEQLKQLGWKIDSHSFCNARKHCAEYGPGAPIPKPSLPPSKRPSLDLPELVSDFFYKDEITRVGSKTIKKKIVCTFNMWH